MNEAAAAAEASAWAEPAFEAIGVVWDADTLFLGFLLFVLIVEALR
jgi:hypothetical protein